jgi:hypothetical protein
LCLIAVPLPPRKTPYSVQLNNDDDNSNNNNNNSNNNNNDDDFPLFAGE